VRILGERQGKLKPFFRNLLCLPLQQVTLKKLSKTVYPYVNSGLFPSYYLDERIVSAKVANV
jgi:hypothetical protein